MWRSYYEQRYAALLADLYTLNRKDYGFSPADSLAIAWYAALLELSWWQLRRENAPLPAYGAVIAQTTSAFFHADNADVRRTRHER